jgi:nucleotide-binding universal stress UspA family protein
MSVTRGSVVAGLSRKRTPLSTLVVDWAVDEAAARGLPLVLLHAQEWPHGASPKSAPDHPAHTWSVHFRAGGEKLLDDARRAAEARRPGVQVTTALETGRAVHVLREAGEAAALVVVGTRRFGGLQDALSGGGKGHALVGHLPCPVALVPETPGNVPADAPVVVGVDGSPASLAAIDLAFAEAETAKAELVAAEVRRPRDATWPEFLEESALHLSELLAGHREQYPGVEVRHEILTGDPAAMLASAARYARCLVVGSRGRGGFRGMLLGSTSRSLVHRTYCPLLVAPAPPDA